MILAKMNKFENLTFVFLKESSTLIGESDRICFYSFKIGK